MRILSYNLWHGLSPTSLVLFKELEPRTRRELREIAQCELIRSLKPDFSFFQEVNPVATRAPKLRAYIEGQVEFHPDLVGAKFLGVGVPINLNSGQAILSGRKWPLKGLGAFSLDSDRSGFVSKMASWQVREQRYALFAESIFPGVGRVLLVNTHLHHGLEDTLELRLELEALIKELGLSENVHDELILRLQKGNERRLREWEVLQNQIERHSARASAVVMAGDFNASPTVKGGLIEKITDAGFKDLWSWARPSEPGFTFDGVANEANHRLQDDFPSTMTWDDLTFDNGIREKLAALVKKHEARQRRIDYVFVRANSSLKSVQAELIGKPVDGLAPSDHFGVLVDIDFEGALK